ncbi:hypothetical protein TRVL_04243 [Trypanosoma vivax]|nr:hypothetical protein TRVL_04243 [Trypanosoma vivax]
MPLFLHQSDGTNARAKKNLSHWRPWPATRQRTRKGPAATLTAHLDNAAVPVHELRGRRRTPLVAGNKMETKTLRRGGSPGELPQSIRSPQCRSTCRNQMDEMAAVELSTGAKK